MSTKPCFLILPALALTLALASSAFALEQGGRAPDIEARDMDGHPFHLADLRGKVVILDFWASWCEPCREAMPALDRLARRYGDRGLVVVGVNVDRSADSARRFLGRTRVSFRMVHDDGQAIAGRYQPPRMPSTFVIDRRGVVRHVQAGFRSGDDEVIERAVRAAL